MFVMLMLGCRPPDAWTPVRTACGLDAPLDWALIMPGPDGERHGLVLPDGCAEALLGDVDAKTQDLLDDLDVSTSIDEHVEAARTGIEPLDGLVVLAWGLYWLAGGDYGAVGDLQSGDYVDPVWVEDFNHLAAEQGLGGEAPLSQVLYNDVSRRISGVKWLPEGAPTDVEMGVRPATRHLFIERPEHMAMTSVWPRDYYSPNETAAGLVHESVHARFAPHRHVECASPAEAEGRYCDADLTGAYGAEFAARWAEITAATSGGGCFSSDAGGYVAAVDVGTVQFGWSQTVMLPVPDDLPDCD